ncbi:PREDICTED: putative CCR4-associated factor 1 homolog 3 [Camelina sativa]|uniref:poly(A)-specific ribonuclease n=1 Tax=Camelina sativa TaxID=90675 RepID=A0ABM0YIW9_CAMSA|nr:PREDICTED: putative CCR4-associated factor 1 homolog 3 [Camelina sativa]
MKQSRGGEVWRWNKEVEMDAISDCLRKSCFIAVDTEFPGCLLETPVEASEETRYRDMRYNVGNTNLIQLGFTLLDGNGDTRGTWEVNFSDFDVSVDAYNEKSIAFLRSNGLNLDKIREEGIGIDEFFGEFAQILKTKRMSWVTFQGSYDKAYLVKGLTGGEPLPKTKQGFEVAVETLLGDVFDVKKIAELCSGISSHYGLQKIADALQMRRVGIAHHAGSDSELTARIFTTMACGLHDYEKRKQQYQDDLMMATSYVPQLPPIPMPMEYDAYPSFGGYFSGAGHGMNYV